MWKHLAKQGRSHHVISCGNSMECHGTCNGTPNSMECNEAPPPYPWSAMELAMKLHGVPPNTPWSSMPWSHGFHGIHVVVSNGILRGFIWNIPRKFHGKEIRGKILRIQRQNFGSSCGISCNHLNAKLSSCPSCQRRTVMLLQ